MPTLDSNFERVAKNFEKAFRAVKLKKNAEVLDVGTGRGYSAIFLATQGYKVTTGEPTEDTSDYSKKNWKENARKMEVEDKIQFQAFSADKMPFEDNRFDGIFFFGVLHHIKENVRNKVAAETARVIKEGGIIAFFEPNAEMLENVRKEHPDHPVAANPDLCFQNLDHLSKRYLPGDMMDIYIYQKTQPHP